MKTRKTLTTLTLLVLLFPVLFVSGCTEELSAEKIAEQMQEKEDNIQDYSYTMQMTSYFGEETRESEVRILQKKPNKSKTVSIKPEEEAGAIVVSDGEFIWTYDPKTNFVMKMELPDPLDTWEMDYVGIIGELLNETEVSLLGVEKIDGRPAYLLETSPKEEKKEEKERTRLIDGTKLWVDKETWIPLRYEMYDSNGDMVMELEIRDLKINTDIPDSEFVFEIPEGATVKTVDMSSFEIPGEMTLEEARESAGFEILIPEYLPEGYEFNHATAYNNSEFVPDGQATETVILRYMKEEESIAISEIICEGQAPEAAIMNTAEDIVINGRNGKYLSLGDMNILEWKIRDINLSLTSSLEKDEMLKIAESIRENA